MLTKEELTRCPTWPVSSRNLGTRRMGGQLHHSWRQRIEKETHVVRILWQGSTSGRNQFLAACCCCKKAYLWMVLLLENALCKGTSQLL